MTKSPGLNVLFWSSAVMVLASLYMIFIFVPTEQTMGVVQRIFYFHVPVAWVAFLAFFIVFVCSVLYLWKRDAKWDIAASSAAELGVVFTSLTLITGSIWAKPVWGAWWTWDVRLTTTLILWFIYVAYLLVRSYVSETNRGARLAAIVGIVGFFDVPVVALSIQLWKTQHPAPVIFTGGLAPSMLATLLVSIAAITLTFSLLFIQAFKIKTLERRLTEIEREEFS